MSLPQGNVLWFLFQWLWLVWILLICPAAVVFAIIAVASSGKKSQRFKRLAGGFATLAAAWTFVFLLFLILL
jgi:hypothetical protein